MDRPLFPCILLLAVVAMTSCAGSEFDRPARERIQVGVLPDQEPSALRERYDPLLEHLTAATGLEMELLIPGDYAELLDWFDEDRVQLAWFGGRTFLEAESRSDALPLVSRDIDREFTTDFLVASSGRARSLMDLEGATLAFGPVLSTSGHLMPREHFRREGIDVEAFFGAVRHSEGHDQTAIWVRDGQVDVGAINSEVVDSMFRDRRLTAADVRVIQTTAPYQDYVWAVRPDVAPSTLVLLRDAFMELEIRVPEHAAILSTQGARGFIPVAPGSYSELREARKRMPADGKGS